MARSSEAIVMMVVDPSKTAVYMEMRNADQSGAGDYFFPGGHVEEIDLAETEEQTRRNATIREAGLGEELGIVLTNFEELTITPQLKSARGTKLYPQVIYEFSGEMPATILDKGNPLLLVPIKEAGKSSQPTVRILSSELEYHVAHAAESVSTQEGLEMARKARIDAEYIRAGVWLEEEGSIEWTVSQAGDWIISKRTSLDPLADTADIRNGNGFGVANRLVNEGRIAERVVPTKFGGIQKLYQIVKADLPV